MSNLNPTHCCVCGRPLTDPVSQERGIGPICEDRYLSETEEAARTQAYKLIREASFIFRDLEEPENNDRFKEICAELAGIGFPDVSAHLAERIKKFQPVVIIRESQGMLAVQSPYNEEALSRWREIPGRQWDRALRCNLVPKDLSAKAALYELLKEFYPGAMATGPKGEFRIPKVSNDG